MNVVEPFYYDLNEAVDYLVKKLSITNLTPKRLIKYIVQFNIPTHIYGFGFCLEGDFEGNQNFDNKIFKLIEQDLTGWNTETGSLFQLPEDSTTLFQFYDSLEVQFFNDVIPLRTLNRATNANESLSLTLSHFSSIAEVFKVSGLYPYLDASYGDINDLMNGRYLGAEIKPQFLCGEIHEFNNEEAGENVVNRVDIENFTVNFEDLLLIKKNLHKLEDYLSGKSVYSPSQIDSELSRPNLKKNRGTSIAKTNAKIVAKSFAQYFWNIDKHKEKRIGTMCDEVYAALYVTEHQSQLPDQTISIKQWIKDVAPDYASNAGRSENEK